jgi:M6 family metalloprotease-like protein
MAETYHARKSLVLYVTVSVFLVALFTPFAPVVQPLWSLEPPAPGEIQSLRMAGELNASLDFARRLGNHGIDSDLLKNAVNRAKRSYLKSGGKTDAEIDMMVPAAPPAGRQGMPTTGNVKILTILIEFQDHTHTNTRNSIHDNIFGAGDPARAPYDSLAVYYDRASYNQLDLSNGNTLGWYQTSSNRAADPGTWSSRMTIVRNLITETLNHYDAQGHDFSQYDNNNDGVIDYFVVIWTGPVGGWATLWWGWQTSFGDNSYTVDGKTLGKFSWQWEARPVGGVFTPIVVIHETGHALGLPDYYDYDGTVGPDGGAGGLDMMDANRGDHNAFSKWVLDWITPTYVFTGIQTLTLNASGTSRDAAYVWPATSPDMFSELFMAQNRHRVGNDNAPGMPGDGMLIWHVDATLNAAGTNFLYDNSFTAHKLLRLMEADGLEEIERGGGADAGDYYKAGKEFGPCSNPSSKKYDNTHSRVKISDFSNAGTSMSAKFEHGASTQCATGWLGVYRLLPAGMAEMALLRKYRDTVLMNSDKGRVYTKLLYENSNEALQVFLTHPELTRTAGEIIRANRDAIEQALTGDDAVISNTDEIVNFLDALARVSPEPLEELAQMFKTDLIKKQEKGEKFLGFGF